MKNVTLTPMKACGIISTAILFFGLMMLMFGGDAFIEAIGHLLIGSIFFLDKNLSALTTNADIYIPGFTAFALSLFVIHYLGKSWSKHRDKSWTKANSFCVGLIFPTLFIISFIVPGILLQLKLLSQTTITTGRGNVKTIITLNLRNCAQALAGHANMKSLDVYPDDIDATLEEYMYMGSIYDSYIDSSNLPREPFIYLGAGVRMDSNENLPLLISSPYRGHNGKKMRVLYTFGYELIEIHDHEVDEWIQSSIDARRQAKITEEEAE